MTREHEEQLLDEPQPAEGYALDRVASLTGTLIEAGNDSSGQPRLIIHATEDQIAGLSPFPLYAEAEITFRWKGSK